MFAQRTLLIVTDPPQCVCVQVNCPVKGDKDEFGCSFSIAWPEGPRIGTAYGYDGIQAILLAMNMIAANLYTSQYHQMGQLRWDKNDDGYGFPLGKTLVDLAQGDDKLL